AALPLRLRGPGCRGRRIDAQVPRRAPQAFRLRQIELPDLLACVVRDREYELRVGWKILPDVVREDRAVRRIGGRPVAAERTAARRSGLRLPEVRIEEIRVAQRVEVRVVC